MGLASPLGLGAAALKQGCTYQNQLWGFDTQILELHSLPAVWRVACSLGHVRGQVFPAPARLGMADRFRVQTSQKYDWEQRL